MKKIFYSIVLCLMMFCTMGFAGCGKGNLVSVSVKEGTLDTVVLVNTELDTNNLVLNATYENGETVEVTKNKDVTITGYNRQKLGEQTLTITYKGASVEVEIYVTADEEDTYEIVGFEKPAFYSYYESEQTKTGDNAHFLKGETYENSIYKVGDDNEFKFLPILTGLKEVEGDLPLEIELDQYISDVTVELKDSDSDNFTVLTDNESDYVVVDNQNSTFDFVDNVATGRVFRITVQPKGLSDKPPITFTIKVVDGWNAYNAKDLSRIDNCVNTATYWATIKNGGFNEDIEAIVLHNNITLQDTDLPAGYFFHEGDADYSAEKEGKMKTWKSMYTRDVAVGEKFEIYGNYFQISAQDVSKCYVAYDDSTKEYDSINSHTALFSFGGDNDYNPDTLQGEVYIENLKLLGNSQRQESGLYSAGLTAINTSSSNIVLENCFTKNFVTHIVSTEMASTTEDDNNRLTINYTKMIDAYSTFLYAARTKNVLIADSLLQGSGGPVIMSTHADNNDGEASSRYTNTTLKNTVVSAYVQGSEAWFVDHGASGIVTQLAPVESGFNYISQQLKDAGVISNTKSMFTTVYDESQGGNKKVLNFYNVIMAEAENPFAVTTPINGSFTLKDGDDNEVSKQDMSDLLFAISKDPSLPQRFVFKSNGVYVTTNANQTGFELIWTTDDSVEYIDIATLLSSTPTTETALAQFTAVCQFFEGDYLHMYMGCVIMGVTMQFYDVVEAD